MPAIRGATITQHVRLERLASAAAGKADGFKGRLPPTLGALVDSVRHHDVLLFAGGLAFYGLVSIVPFLAISFWVAGGIVGEDGLRELGENVRESAPGSADISGFIDSMAGIGTGIGIGALVAALWPATAYGSGLVRAFDRIAESPSPSLKGIRGRIKALLFVVLLPVFVLGALAASYVTSTLVDDGALLMVLSWVLALVAGFVAALFTIAVIYVVFGPGSLPFAAVLQGAAAAAGAIAVMSVGYMIYLGKGADFQERVAGSGLAAVVLLALWLYLANVILLVGFALARSAAGDRVEVDDVPGDAAGA